ncbi:MAG: response regulator transcription factor [Acidimicrobiia bacterium]|nr:response regulator transcription factor [Acidimicrobiia bacterium]MDH3396263.1 response regulator transcription factor [Acidimicrobiia bacterium]MDH5614961.1 response regulator transcription factor [Acidimicrobiia bacterium]
MIEVLIADDHTLFAEGVSQALAAIPDLHVAGTASGGMELVEMAKKTRADVLLIDLEMPDLSGFEVLEKLKGSLPAIIVTMHADAHRRSQAVEAGARGFLSKSTPLPELAAAVRAVSAGENLTSLTTTLREILDNYMEPTLDPGAASLTARERELLTLLGEGVSATEELAERLYISPKTVKNHLASIYEKLSISDRTQAAVEAIRLGLVPNR